MSNQRTFPLGCKEDIFKEIQGRVFSIGKIGSLILGSSNTLGIDVPLENIKYFSEACRKYCE